MRIRRVTRGIQIGPLRLYWMGRNWKTKPHPYWYARKGYDGSFTFQTGRFELFWFPPSSTY